METTKEYYISVSVYYWLIPIFFLLFSLIGLKDKSERRFIIGLVVLLVIVMVPASIRSREIFTNVEEIGVTDGGKFNIQKIEKSHVVTNPSIMLLKDKWYVAYRYAKWGRNSWEFFVTYNNIKEFEEGRRAFKTKIHYDEKSNKKPFCNGLEDGRIFSYRNKPYITASKADMTKKRDERQYLVDLIKKKGYYLRYPRSEKSRQKNWAPFVFNDRLFMMVFFDPMLIVEVPNLDKSPINCKIVFEETKAKQQFEIWGAKFNPYNNIKSARNSTPPKPLRSGFYGMFLHHKKNNLLVNAFSTNMLYTHAFVIFRPKFDEYGQLKIESVKRSKLFNIFGKNTPKACFFLGGFELIKETNEVLLVYGHNDKESRWVKIPFQNLIKDFSPKIQKELLEE